MRQRAERLLRRNDPSALGPDPTRLEQLKKTEIEGTAKVNGCAAELDMPEVIASITHQSGPEAEYTAQKACLRTGCKAFGA